MIVSLLDGELSVEESADIYSEISSNPELQEEMNNQIALKNLMANQTTLPPSHLRGKILKNAGLLTPLYISSLKYGVPVILAFLIGYLIPDFNETETQQNIAEVQSYEKPELNLTTLKQIPVSSNRENKINYNQDNFISKTSINNTSQNNTIANSTVENNSAETYNSIAYSDIPVSETEYLNVNTYQQNFNNALEPTHNFSKFNFDDREFYESNYSLHARGLNLQNLHTNNLGPQERSGLNNFSVAAYYNLDQNFMIGFEAGQEDFIQKFSFNDGNYTTSFEQNYTAIYGGISLKYLSNELKGFNNIRYYSRAFVGGISTGPLARIEAGINFRLNSRISMTAGYEFAHTVYFYRSNMFHSSKNGFTYGLNFKI